MALRAGERTFTDAQIELICQVTHEALRAYKAGISQDKMPTWLRAPKWMKEATRESVIDVLRNPDQTPQMQHDQWVQMKRGDGWRLGPEKNATRKTHPLLVPYPELDEAERRKDALLIATVRALVDG